MAESTCLLVWQSPAFEDTYSMLRPGVRVPNMDLVAAAVEARYGQVLKRYLLAEGTVDDRTMSFAGFALREPSGIVKAAAEAGRVVVLGGDTTVVRDNAPEGCEVISFDLSQLLLPAPLPDPYEEMCAQVVEVIQMCVRLSRIIRRTTLHELLRRWLTDFDARLHATGHSFDELVDDLTVRNSWSHDGGSITVTSKLGPGTVVQVPPDRQRGVVLRVGEVDISVLVGASVVRLAPSSVRPTVEQLEDGELLSLLLDTFAPDAPESAQPVGVGAVLEKSNDPLQKYLVVAVRNAAMFLVELFDEGVLAVTTFEVPLLSKKFRPSTDGPPLSARVVTLADLAPGHGYLAYTANRNKTLLSLLIHEPDGWKSAGVFTHPGDHVMQLVGAHGPVGIRVPGGEVVPAQAGVAPRKQLVEEPVAVIGDPVDPEWLQAYMAARGTYTFDAAGTFASTPLSPGDVVVARHGPRDKRDTLIVVETRPSPVAVIVAPQERSHLVLHDPTVFGASAGAGIRFTRTEVDTARIERILGRCGEEDLASLDEYRAWHEDRYAFRPGRVLFVRRPGEEQRGPRPAVVMGCSEDGTSMVLRPLTSSPRRNSDSGHELLDPASVAPWFQPGKVRDVEFTIGVGRVVSLSGRLSARDWEKVAAQKSKLNDIGKRRR